MRYFFLSATAHARATVIKTCLSRTVACSAQIRGDPEGQHTVFWVHGSPSCRLEAR